MTEDETDMEPTQPAGVNINTLVLVAGFAITLGTIVFYGGGEFAALRAADEAALARAEVQSAQIDAIQADRQRRLADNEQWKREHEIRVRALEIASAGISTRLTSIETGIVEIKQLLREQNGVKP